MQLIMGKGDVRTDLHRELYSLVKADLKYRMVPPDRDTYIRESLSSYWSHMKDRHDGRYKMTTSVVDRHELIRSIQRHAGIAEGSGLADLGNGLTAFAMPRHTWYLREEVIRGIDYQVLWLSWWNGPPEERPARGPFRGLLATDRMPQMVTEMDMKIDSIIDGVSEVMTEVARENMIERILKTSESARKGR